MKKRIEWVDVLKGIAIILVVIGHNSDRDHLRFYWIYGFHMPLFFFLSGYVFHMKTGVDFNTFVSKKFQSLIVPYIVFSGISIWLYCTFINTSLQVLKTFWFASRIEMGGETPYNTSLWFLPSLFLIEVYFFVLERNISNVYLKAALILATSVTGFMLTQKSVALPLSLDWSMYYLLYFALGNIIRKHTDKIQNVWLSCKNGKCAQYIYILCILLNAAPAIGAKTRFSSVFGDRYFFISCIVSFAGIALFCSIAKYICKFCRIKRFFLYFGRNSLIVLALHTLLRDYGISPIIWGITGNMYATEWVRWVYIVGSLILCVPFCQMINTCFPAMLGKKQVQ